MKPAPRWGPFHPAAVVLVVESCLIGGALLAALAYWPAARLMRDPAALARVQIAPVGEHVARVEVSDGSGRAVRVRLGRAGGIAPVDKLRPGSRLSVQVTVRRSRWIGWLVGRTEQLRAVVRTPATRVTGQLVHPAAGTPVRVRFSRPVRLVTLQVRDAAAQRLVFRRARRVIPVGVLASGRHVAGSVLVAGVVRSWERLPAPVRVDWFAAGPRPKVTVRPAPGAKLVPGAPILLTFSRPVAGVLGSRRPQLSPQTPGSWHEPNDHTLVFRPSGVGFPLGARVDLRLPRSLQVISGADPADFRTLSWRVPFGSRQRLRELLAELGYLPVDWQPARAPVALTGAAQARAAVEPPAGTFTWRYRRTPAALKAIWSSGTKRPTLIRGAVMAFEARHGLTVDGYPDAAVWKALLDDELAGRTANGGYSYVLVTESLPQTLTLWHAGRVVLRTAVNTGIPSRPTAHGTYPVYLHLSSTTMDGTNPDGTRYHDVGVPWVNYFNGGDAIHGFVRPGYGYPQSLGCVEAPIPVAARIWPYVRIGTLVTIAA